MIPLLLKSILSVILLSNYLFAELNNTKLSDNFVQARLLLQEPVTKNGLITIKWQGPNLPQDQIVLSVWTPSGFEPISFVYTTRGNPVIFQNPEADILEVSYKMHGKETIARLQINTKSSR